MSQPIFALIDCNNFFVSCERLFRPDLNDKPVVVLSSGDGCVVARSNEAKALGIPMGAPAFKYRQAFKEGGVVQFSGNFSLYGDVSRRITELLTTITPRIEVYSVDESFLDLSQLEISDFTSWGREVASTINRLVGIPVSIGTAPTKTLAKLASDRAKKQPELQSAKYLGTESDITKSLKETQLEDIWGVGWRFAPALRASGLKTAYDIAQLKPNLARQLFGGVRGEQLLRELNGQSCLPLTEEGQLSKSIARTRTFGEDTNQFHILEAAIATFTAQAAFRLRVSGQLTKRASLFLTSNRHKPNYRRYGSEVRLLAPTADTGQLSSLLIKALSNIYDSAVSYHRAGVMLYDFVPSTALQTDLFKTLDVTKHNKDVARQQAIDNLNARYGKQKVHYAAADLADSWQPKHNVRSPRYTSSWDELPKVKIAST